MGVLVGILGAMFFGVGAAAFSPVPRNSMEEYSFCVWNGSAEFASTKEPADIVVEAAKARCAGLRAGAIDFLVGESKRKRPTDMLTDSDLRRLANESLESVTRSQAILIIVEARSKTN